MQRSILASVIILSLSACGGDSNTAITSDGPLTTEGADAGDLDGSAIQQSDDTVAGDTVVVTNVEADESNTSSETVNVDVVTTDDGNIDATTTDDGIKVVDTDASGGEQITNDDSTTDTQPISDDAGSSTSDGGQTTTSDDTGSSSSNGGEATIPDDAGSSTSDGGETAIPDDAGSSTSDGGETAIPDDTGSNTSDGGETAIPDDAGSSTSDGETAIPDDAGSSTSDGGETAIPDDAGSSTSDGGLIADDAASGSSDGDQTPTQSQSADQGGRDTNAGSFTSDSVGGNVIRRSNLSASGMQNICTIASNPNDFSDTRVGDFILHNNAWRTFRAFPDYQWEQCITTNTNGAVVGWNYDWGPGNPFSEGNGTRLPSGDFYVRSYPELIYGVKDEFRTSAPQSETGFPVRLSELPNIQIDYSYSSEQFGTSRTVDASNNPRFPNGTTISGERNVAIESFYYEPDAAGNCSTDIVSRNPISNHKFEVMVWLDAGAERLPAAPSGFVADLEIRGEQYKVYTKRDDPRYIAFVAQNPQTTGTIFWNDFTDWARDNSSTVSEQFGALYNTNPIQNDWCVANILVGTEIFWGAGNMNLSEWTITQSR